MTEDSRAIRILIMNALAFTACFAVWTMNGVLITFLVENGLLKIDAAQMGWLIGIPVLTGALTRLPVGMLTDKYGGKWIFAAVMLLAAIPTFLMSYANTYSHFFLASLGFGLAGASFAVGIAYTSVWFRKEHQGTALGIFGAGNAGAAVTSLGAPRLLAYFTDNGANLEGWRTLPQVYAAMLVGMTILFILITRNRLAEGKQNIGLAQSLAPLKNMRVWRFGLYYFLVFGGFVALAQWLIPYYVNVYAATLATAGLLAMMFSLPSGVIRAMGGWMSDKWGARTVMYVILIVTLVASVMLILPPMTIHTPGEGIMAGAKGAVTAVSENIIVVEHQEYVLKAKSNASIPDANQMLVLPIRAFWQEPMVAVGDQVVKKQLLAKGVTQIYFQANIWVFTFLVFVVGITTGIGKAAVYKHIADYFPKDVGVVGGMVGVIGALGGFVMPIFFGYMVNLAGIWTATWVFIALLTSICLIWMHIVIRRMMRQRVPDLIRQIEDDGQYIEERELVAPAAGTQRHGWSS